MPRWFARRFVARTVAPCFFVLLVLWLFLTAMDISGVEEANGVNIEEMAHIEVHKVNDNEETMMKNATQEVSDNSYSIFLKSMHDSTFPNVLSRQRDVSLLEPRDYAITGHLGPQTKFLTIGIPTVYRDSTGYKYLMTTLSSLLSNVELEDMSEMTIFIFLADMQFEKRNKIKSILIANYQRELQSGILVILEVNPEVYPPLTGLKQNYKDSAERVTWRSKQVCDFAFMFYLASNLSDYYVQIEDDVITTKDYLPKMKAFIGEQKVPWVTLSFSELGFIGKLFASTTLVPLARFFVLFYQEMPVDFLYEHYAKLLTLPKMPLRKPTLFQHMGDHSSLVLPEKQKGKPLRDRFFSFDHSPIPALLQGGHNPYASLYTTLLTFQKNHAKYAYQGPGDKFFWATSPKEGDTYTIVFPSALQLSAVAVVTGHAAHPVDTLREAVLEAGGDLVDLAPSTNRPDCAPWRTLGEFLDGTCEVDLSQANLTEPLRCLRIRVTEAQEEWLIIDRITVVTNDTSSQASVAAVAVTIVILLLVGIVLCIKCVFCDNGTKPPRHRTRRY